MPALKSLPDPDKPGEFVALDNSDAFETVFPVFENGPDGTPHRVIGCILYRNRTTYAVAYDPEEEKWKRVATSKRDHPVFTDVEDFTQRHVATVGDDIDSEQAVHDQLYARLRETYGDVFEDTIDDLDDLDGGVPIDISCSCETPHLEFLPVTDELDIGRCDGCNAMAAVRFHGEVVMAETLLTDEWLAEGDQSRIEVRDGASGDHAYLDTDSEAVSRAAVVVYVISMVAKLENPFLNIYNHEQFNALVYVRDGTVAGYATWNDSIPADEPNIIRQLYLRPDHRRSGIGANCLATLADTDVDASDYVYFEEPNSEVWGLYERAKYADKRVRDPTLPEIVPISLLEPRPAYPEGQEDLDSVLLDALGMVFDELDQTFGSDGWVLGDLEWETDV